jgi:hypothetical protein
MCNDSDFLPAPEEKLQEAGASVTRINSDGVQDRVIFAFAN